jgi:hypothetical protein
LSSGAIIENVNPFGEPARSRHGLPRQSSAVRRRSRVRASLLASALAGPAALSLLLSACGGSPASHVAQLGSTVTTTQSSASTTTSAAASRRQSALAYSGCMRAHGVPNFPDPDSQGDFGSLTQQALKVSKQQSLAANHACKRLIPQGGTGSPQLRQEKLAFALKLAQCIRRHGFPAFPDPTASHQRAPSGIDPSSPQFEAADATCKRQAQQEVGLP